MSKNSEIYREIKYITYFQAIEILKIRFNAKPEDLAVWVLFNESGMKAYLNANEFNPPPEFSFAMLNGVDDHSYLKPLMACWFDLNQIENYEPCGYYITGKDLITRWSKHKSIDPKTYIDILVKASRLQDIHPIMGLTQAGTDDENFPPIEDGLFSYSEVERLELEEFTIKFEKEKKLKITDYNPEWQIKANEVAHKFFAEKKRKPTKREVCKLLEPILEKKFDNINRRIKSEW